MCEIAEVLMALQQVGNVKYIGSCITIPCKAEIIPDVRKLHNLMTSELKDWMEEVRAARHDHYELNYYTTPQLLTLRRVLGHLRSLVSKSPIDSSNVHVLALLRSVVPDISMHSIRDALQLAVWESSTASLETYIKPVSNKAKRTEDLVATAKKQITKEVPTQHALHSRAVDRLSAKQREILDSFVKMYGQQCEKIVLKALEDGEQDQTEIENLVMDHDEQAVQSCEEESSEDEDEVVDASSPPSAATEPTDAGTRLPSRASGMIIG